VLCLKVVFDGNWQKKQPIVLESVCQNKIQTKKEYVRIYSKVITLKKPGEFVEDQLTELLRTVVTDNIGNYRCDRARDK